MELTELVSVARMNAQQWCWQQERMWEDFQAGVDFFGAPFSYRYLEPNSCCLDHIQWTNSPYTTFIASLIAEVKQDATRLRSLLE